MQIELFSAPQQDKLPHQPPSFMQLLKMQETCLPKRRLGKKRIGFLPGAPSGGAEALPAPNFQRGQTPSIFCGLQRASPSLSVAAQGLVASSCPVTSHVHVVHMMSCVCSAPHQVGGSSSFFYQRYRKGKCSRCSLHNKLLWLKLPTQQLKVKE